MLLRVKGTSILVFMTMVSLVLAQGVDKGKALLTLNQFGGRQVPTALLEITSIHYDNPPPC